MPWLDVLIKVLPLIIEFLPVIIDCFDSMPPERRTKIFAQLEANPQLAAKIGVMLLQASSEGLALNESRDKFIQTLEQIADGQ